MTDANAATKTVQIKNMPSDLWVRVVAESKRRNMTVAAFVAEACRNKIRREQVRTGAAP